MADDKQKWNDLVAKDHRDQAVWFLNAFWNDGLRQDAEKVWAWVQEFEKLAKEGDSTNCDLDEFVSHRFLEKQGSAVTVLKLRATLQELDVDKNKRMAISEFLLFHYKKNWRDLVLAPQGDPEEVEKAQAMVDEANRALDDVMQKLDEQKVLAESLKVSEAKAKEAEAVAAKAVEELKVAVREVEEQEAAYKNKCDTLKKKSEEGGVVSRNRAKNELEQLLGQDPLPLRQAKLTAEAAVRKSEKARKAAEAEAENCAKKREEAEEGAARLEVSVKEAEGKRDEALAFLDRVKASGAGAGQVWMMQRALYERQQYLPKSKQTMSYPEP
mmetsp:Transcript_6808/g.19267  ORF Transcript_6808/g.19267 Transcript_6808/m.19267 type:complete len:327 (+) Transcript_6808:139-1119(+)|eukprot:CAMPEP_0119131150 /NCGR_PEP_ID=MMETSP1310-20130426/9583_1 /TAXON_ID=464262 /ORGANISM="Genus nov. species nov., Strain RCC2339" /LENGTH=326 /DNA_ID=CAMNT_0007121703 /DNA_START=85 /DNA_END=1065 /DNA_ORIENTATION=+